MEKYWVFRQLLDFVADHAEVVDADMSNYSGNMEIIGEADGQTIRITAHITEEENHGN